MPRTEELSGLPDSPGVSPKKIIALDNAIEAWRAVVDKRMKLTEQECAARDRVLEVMHDRGVTTYLYHDTSDKDKLVEIIAGKEKVKFKNPEDKDDEEKD